ncbi:MAG: zinc dependent phospholipase C family protein [Proteobacteria bacterium]|nr:zinc dependent phospholipase C family protein [Pseudomonadota bacterium]
MLFIRQSHLLGRLQTLFLVIIGFVFFPRDAFAWGPVAHIDFSLQLLAGTAALAPMVGRLLNRHSTGFLYGSLAADSVVGKNFASELSHCHSWTVARKLLSDARQHGERYEVFILGYLSHLAADVVAHNHFIPARLVAHYQSKGVGHLYWEARFDQRLLDGTPEVRDTWQELSRLNHPEYDRFLAERLEPTLFSHRLSTCIYRGSLGIQRRYPWQGTMTRIDAKSKLPLFGKEISRWRRVSVAMAALTLNDPLSEELRLLDPAGRLALDTAMDHRRILRLRHRRRGKPVSPNIFIGKTRTAFGSSIPPRGYL